MLIRGFRDLNDTRFYVPIIVYSAYFKIHARFNFLIDTGAERTLMSCNDANHYGVLIRTLPRDDDKIFVGVGGGTVNGYLLPQSTLIFKSSTGKFDLPVGDLSVADYLTVDGRSYPASSSILAIDILDKFDLLFEGDSNTVFLRLKIRR